LAASMLSAQPRFLIGVALVVPMSDQCGSCRGPADGRCTRPTTKPPETNSESVASSWTGAVKRGPYSFVSTQRGATGPPPSGVRTPAHTAQARMAVDHVVLAQLQAQRLRAASLYVFMTHCVEAIRKRRDLIEGLWGTTLGPADVAEITAASLLLPTASP
jgi:hypothetical protein